jgi:stalled ribosome rescue protein Dom34
MQAIFFWFPTTTRAPNDLWHLRNVLRVGDHAKLIVFVTV